MFGNKIRELRESKGMLLRQVAAILEVDTATVSKIERGDRSAKENQLELLSKIFEIEFDELKTIWLADKIYQIVENENKGGAAIKVAEKEYLYKKSKTLKKASK